MNNCIDGVRQDAIDICIGNHIPRLQTVPIKASRYTIAGAFKAAIRICTSVLKAVKAKRLIVVMLMLMMLHKSFKNVDSNSNVLYYGVILTLISGVILLTACTAVLEIDGNSNKLAVRKSLHVYGIGGHPAFTANK
eukprot:14384-Heterococcus_DN1.PRE.1